MHSQSAHMDLPSPNLAPFLLLRPVLTRHPADSCLNPAFPSLILTRDILNEWSSQGEAKGRPMNVVVDTPA